MLGIDQIKMIAEAKARQVVGENHPQGTVSTTDATVTDVLTIEIDDYVGGLLKMRAIGFDGANYMSGERFYAFKKVAGVVTMATPSANIYTYSTATFSAVSSSGNIVLRVQGLAGVEMNWVVEYELLTVVNEPSL